MTSLDRRIPAHLWALVALLVLLLAFSVPPSPVHASHTPPPTSVAIAGNLQSKLGCPGDWQPECTATHLAYDANDDVWPGSWTIPAGNYEYKAALNNGWAENYGRNATRDGPNIPLSLATDATVKFYYDHKTHWVTDNQNSIIATAPGNYQSKLGCSGDWDPGCLRSWLEDPNGDGLYTFETTALPAGNYEAKAAINEGWDENYGQGGIRNGPNIPFTVPNDGARVTFRYDPASHVLSISAGHGHDNNVEYFGLGHDSQDSLYRVPFGAITPDTQLILRFRTYHDDATGVRVRFYDTATSREFFQDMTVAASSVACYDPAQPAEKCDFWQTTYTPAQPTTLYYRFIATDGSATAYYADDSFKDGGWGQATPTMVDNSYAVTVYDPAFQPIPWLRDAVIYQVFPDRFRNGDPRNDPSPLEPRYGYPTREEDQILNKAWGDLPEGYCRAYENPAQPCTEGPRGRDYFGGDLRGLRQKLNYLQSLGITAIYLNPIFESASNHGYDTQDYKAIDHFFGDMAEWRALVDAAHSRGMKIILDGVFNHVSSDSPYFDRYRHFQANGACEDLLSPFRAWFFFRDVTPGTGTCTGPGGINSATYEAWFGFESLPVFNKNEPGVRNLIYRSNDAVARYWLDLGADGWRLDVMGDGSFPAEFWRQFRTAVKSTKPDAPIIGELWKKDELLPKAHGDQADTAQHYRFRNAILGFFGKIDNKGFVDDGQSDQPPSLFARKLMSIREDYPDATYYTLMNLMDSHDTRRILWSLTPGANNREDKEFDAANLALGKQLLQLARIVQMTTPGAPAIYYGDEVGVTGDDDPDDRRTFPWVTPKVVDIPASPAGTGYVDSRETLRNHLGAQDIFAGVDTRPQTPRILHGGIQFDLGSIPAGAEIQSAEVRLTGRTALYMSPDDGGHFTLRLLDPSVDANWTQLGYYHLHNAAVAATLSPVLGDADLDAGKSNTFTFGDAQLAALQARLNSTNRASFRLDGTATFPYGREIFGWTARGPGSPVLHVEYVEQYYGAGGDHALFNQYRRLINLRQDHPVLRTGQLTFLVTDDAHRTLAYLMRSDTDAAVVALNRNRATETLTINAAGRLPDTAQLTDALGTVPGATTTNGVLTVTLPPLSAAVLLPTPGQDLTPPDAPANLRATAGNGQVSLSWNAVSGAADYRLYRSPVTGGGYTLVTMVSTTSHVDTTVVNGQHYYYVVRAVDAAGNEGPASNEAAATPAFPIGYAVLQWPKTINHILGVAPTETIYGQVYVAGYTDASPRGDPAGILAQVGFGPRGSDPATWGTWKAMAFNSGHTGDNNYEYMSNLRPEQTGTFDLLVRFSTDGGLTWAYGDQDGYVPGTNPGTNQPGVLTVLPNPDTTPLAAPTHLRVLDWSANFIKLQWDPVSDAAEYWVYRHEPGGSYDEPIARLPASTTTFTDSSVAGGITYNYVVHAVDAALNLSGPSNEVSQRAELKLVNVTFRVRVPAETPPDDTVYIPGNIDLLGPWNPGKQPLVNQGGGIWEVTLQILDGTALEYKYTRGTWDMVEWWGSIVSVANRHLSVSFGTTGSQLVDNTATDWGTGPDEQKAVQYWRDPLVAATTPTNGASGPAPATVTATFSRDIQPVGSDFSPSVVVERNTVAVAGTVTLSGGKTLVWTPTAPLSAGTYRVTIFNVRSNLGGDSVPMQKPYVFSFTVSP